MSSSEHKSVVRRCFGAWSRQDRAQLERLISEDFHFTSPLDNRLDRETFFERCWPNSANMQSFDLKRVVQDGDLIVVTYELTMKAGKKFRNTEAYTVRDGQVHEVEVYFGWDLPHKAPSGGFVSQ